MRYDIYNVLVNKHIGITTRYHRFHDGSAGVKKLLSWAYLLWLNFAFYFLGCRFLGRMPEAENYEQKPLEVKVSETEKYMQKAKSVEDYMEQALKADVVSFDIFDTLIFRPVAIPTDVFHMIGEKLGILDFSSIRAWTEWDARMKHQHKYGNTEVNLSEIWKNLEQDVGLLAEKGMELEQTVEEEICFANPFMKQIWNKLMKSGKNVIITSDMYLPKECIENILHKNGYTGYEKLYLSNEYGKSKADGKLYKAVLKDYPKQKLLHIGDNIHSDVKMAEEAGLSTLHYQNVNKNMLLHRPYDMSAMIGSAYRGVVSTYLYNGLNKYSMEYEYGYIYGGLFVLGYCHFIHDYCQKNHVDKLMFLSRDGDILKQVYDYLYPDDNTEYVYWSRKAATKMEAYFDKHDFFRRFIYHKVNQKYTIEDILKSMELEFLAEELSDWKDIWIEKARKNEADSKILALKQLEEDETVSDKVKVLKKLEKEFSEEELSKKREKKFVDLKAEYELTDRNGYLLRQFIEAKWDQVLAHYSGQMEAAKCYYEILLGDAKKAVAVDIGWAGSGAMVLRHLVNHEWQMDCDLVGIIAGTNTIHNAEPDASESFLQSGKLVAYLYSQAHNRDLLKKHDPNKDYNVYWELLLSSPTPSFKGFYEGKTISKNADDIYMESLDITLKFGKYDDNLEGIRQIQQGIMDFAVNYRSHFGDPVSGDFSYMYNISGRDAYAPMLVAASHNEKYLKAIEKKFNLEINVN